MEKVKVTLSLDKETWKKFQMHCIKNEIIASDMVNDIMAATTGAKPRKLHYEITVVRSQKI
jgi:hypothetical protein